MAKKADLTRELIGRTGNASGIVQAPGTTNMIYVRVGGSTMKVINDLVPLIPDQEVVISQEKDGWRVKGTRAQRSGGGTPTSIPHGETHELYGSDEVAIDLRQITNLRVRPVRGTLTVTVGRGVIVIRGGAKVVIPSSPVDLSGHVPTTTGKSRWVLVSVSPAGEITLTDGADFDTSATDLTTIPAKPAGHKRLAAIRMYYGQTVITENRLATDVIDLRFEEAEPHKTEHQAGGADEISVAGLSGVLATRQDADKLQGRTVASTAPSTGQAIVWNGSNWVPGTMPGSVTVEEVDGTPSVAASKIKLPNGSVTDNGDGSVTISIAGSGDVSGPSSAVDGHLAVFDGASGKVLKDGGVVPTLLPLDVPPSSPSTYDDEFNGTSLDAKWTCPLSSGADLGVSTTLSGGWMFMEPSTTGTASTGKRAFGMRQNSPTGSFTVMAKIANDLKPDDVRCGILVARTTATAWAVVSGLDYPASGKGAQAIGIGSYSETADCGAYDNWYQQVAGHPEHALWVKCVWDSSAGSLKFYYSMNGVHWAPSWVSRTGLSQPDRIGIIMYANNANTVADHRIGVDWFRVTTP
jgi:hypothetical protein